MIKIVKCLRVVPVTLADRRKLEEERLQHEQVIGRLSVRWDRLAGALKNAQRTAERDRMDAGSQALSAEHDRGAEDPRVAMQAIDRLSAAGAKRARADARLGKLWRWRRDIGGGVRGRIAIYGKRVSEIDKVLVCGVQDLPVELRIDTDAGTCEVTRVDTGHVVALHELTASQKKKYVPPPPTTAAERTRPIPLPRTPEEEAREAEPEVIDEMPPAAEETDESSASDFAEFIARGRSIEERLLREFGAAEAERIVDAIRRGEPGDVVIEEARARKASGDASKSAEPPPATPKDPAAAASEAFRAAMPQKPKRPRKKGGAR